jgi:uncharacterized protein YjbI with pentapeptide repeats
MEGELRIIVEKVSTFDRLLNVEKKGLFKSLLDIGIGIATGNVGDIIKGSLATLEGITSEENDPIPHRAYVLLYNGMRRGLMTLIDQHLAAIQQATGKGYDAPQYQALLDELDKKWNETSLQIDYRFFDDPGKFPFVHTLRGLVREWLIGLGLPTDEAKRIVLKLGPLMASALDALYKERPAYFAKVKEATQEDLGMSKEWQLYRYQQQLIAEWEKPIFDESFGLDKLYVELNACYPIKDNASGDSRDKNLHRVVASEQHILSWLDQPDAAHKIIILRGGPGSGKSSLMKKIVHEVALQGDRPVYAFQLQHFKIKEDFEEAIKDYFKNEEQYLRDIPDILSKSSEGGGKAPLLVFDGLDELSKTDANGQELARMFCDRLNSLLSARSRWDGWDMRVVLTGRDFVIQKISGPTFGKKAQILELLPLTINNEDETIWIDFAEPKEIPAFGHYDFEDPDGHLDTDQRAQWWRQFWGAKGDTRNDVPEIVQQDAYSELSQQPLLSYLLAKVYLHGRLDVIPDANVNFVYEELIDSLRTRDWGGKDGYKHSTFDDKDKFFRLMEEMAVSAWLTGDVRVTNTKRLEARCKDQNLMPLLETFRANGKTTINDLVVSSFAKLHKEDMVGGDLIEFTHKSFGEYLVARRLVALAKDIVKVLRREEEDSMQTAMSRWVKTCSYNVLTAEIWEFLTREVQANANFSLEGLNINAYEIQISLADLFSAFINTGFKLENGGTNLHAVYRTRNVEINLWMLISAFARISKQHTTIKWKGAEQPKRILGWTYFHQDLTFVGKGFHRVVFPLGVNLIDADLNVADLEEAILIDAELTGATLLSANLRGANLSGANLDNADLSDADLHGANLDNASFEGANLIGSEITSVTLIGASFVGSNLVNVNFSNANLNDADFVGANLRGAQMANANLTNADLTDAHLHYANLSGAICYPIQVDDVSLDGQLAYDYLVSQGAINVPLPPKENDPPH